MSVERAFDGWERVRVLTCFAVFAVGACLALYRLADLQVVRTAAALRRTVRSEIVQHEVAAPRGTIVDRSGVALAEDRPVWEVRAGLVLTAPARQGVDEDGWQPADFERPRNRVASDIALALGRDRETYGDPVARDELREALRARIDAALERRWKQAREAGRPGLPRATRVDVLLARGLDHADALDGLQALDFRRAPKDSPERDDELLDERGRYRVECYSERRYLRRYAAPEVTFGVVGTVRDGVGVVGDDRVPVSGLERLKVLLPREQGLEGLRVDAGRRTYWTAARTEPAAPVRLHSTLDLALMRAADAELDSAAEKVRRAYQSPPEWGALMLIDVADGAVRAAVSWTSDKQGERDPFGAFAPTQRLFEPGSVVKPLHVAMVVDRGLTHWDEVIATGDDGISGRTIKDDHPRPSFTVREVLSRSSNIGAVKLGLRMGPEGIEQYLRNYRFGEQTALLLPGERVNRRSGRPADITTLNANEQRIYAGPSVLFGYQLHVTTAQVARAFLSFLSGRPRELRLVDALEVDGQTHVQPAPELDATPFLGEKAALETRRALIDVVHEGTARHALPELSRAIQRGEVAGKTGTSEYTGEAFRWDGSKVHGNVRTALFAGFAPVDAPRYLVVCVLQKVGAAKFYGGTYAAPAAIRLLLRAVDGEGDR